MHKSWEFIYCTSGDGRLIFENFILPYKAFDVVVIPPSLYHSNESENGFTNIHLNVLDPALNAKAPMILMDDSNHFLLDAFTAAFYFFTSKAPSRAVLLQTYADLIVNLLLSNQGAPKHSATTAQIESCLIANYPDENFELDTYLRELPFNYDYIRKLFKKELGVTPHQYLCDIRLQTAAKNLRLSDGQGSYISEIAHMCGFGDPLYFSRMFKKKYGVSPSQFQAGISHKEREAVSADDIRIPL